jgi:hypothetical protein
VPVQLRVVLARLRVREPRLPLLLGSVVDDEWRRARAGEPAAEDLDDALTAALELLVEHRADGRVAEELTRVRDVLASCGPDDPCADLLELVGR